MIGSGVFVSAGFMAQEMGPGWILGAWVIGSVIAMMGSYAYATLAQTIPASGGEYRYLADLFHPALGVFAGWASLVVGFAGPVAINAAAAAAYASMLLPLGHPTAVALLLILAL